MFNAQLTWIHSRLSTQEQILSASQRFEPGSFRSLVQCSTTWVTTLVQPRRVIISLWSKFSSAKNWKKICTQAFLHLIETFEVEKRAFVFHLIQLKLTLATELFYWNRKQKERKKDFESKAKQTNIGLWTRETGDTFKLEKQIFGFTATRHFEKLEICMTGRSGLRNLQLRELVLLTCAVKMQKNLAHIAR